MSFLSSNQPYQQVDDGIADGFIKGSIVGGAAAGATHMFGAQGLNAMQDGMQSHLQRAENRLDAVQERSGVDSRSARRLESEYEDTLRRTNRVSSGVTGLQSAHARGFGGGWKGRAASYGGSILAGGLLGAGSNYLND